jgi:hypothetical protein
LYPKFTQIRPALPFWDRAVFLREEFGGEKWQIEECHQKQAVYRKYPKADRDRIGGVPAPGKSEIKPLRIGIHLPSFYSSWLTWGEMAEIFIKAQGDPLKMRNVVNNWWAQPWKEGAIAKTVKEILTNKVDILRLVFPKGSVALTCGIDPGQGGFKSTAER